MAGGHPESAPVVTLYVLAEQESVAAENLPVAWVPDEELAAGGLHYVERVDVAAQAGTAAAVAEGFLAQAANLAHHCRGLTGADHIQLVTTLVGGAEQAVGGEFGRQGVFVYGVYYRLHAFGLVATTLAPTRYNIGKVNIFSAAMQTACRRRSPGESVTARQSVQEWASKYP